MNKYLIKILKTNDGLYRFFRYLFYKVGAVVAATNTSFRFILGGRERRRLDTVREYFSPTPVAGYIGWIGKGNLGDEALLLSFKKLFPGIRLIDLSDTIPVELFLHRRMLGRKQFDMVFLGGGTLINGSNYLPPLEKALSRGEPCVVFGTGVRNPQYWSNVWSSDPSESMTAWVESLTRASRVLVRGPDSASILAQYSLDDVQIVGDPALSICSARPPREGRASNVVINVGSKGVIWGDQQQVNRVIGQVCRNLLDRGVEVNFVAMNASDESFIRLIVDEHSLAGRVKFWFDYEDIYGTINFIKRNDIMIGERLHAVVLGCGSGVPSISIAYRPKCLDFMRSLGLEKYCIRTDELTLESLMAMIRDVESKTAELSAAMNKRCDELRALQEEFAAEITQEILAQYESFKN